VTRTRSAKPLNEDRLMRELHGGEPGDRHETAAQRIDSVLATAEQQRVARMRNSRGGYRTAPWETFGYSQPTVTPDPLPIRRSSALPGHTPNTQSARARKAKRAAAQAKSNKAKAGKGNHKRR
jgi:hypothetical protein